MNNSKSNNNYKGDLTTVYFKKKENRAFGKK